MRPIRKPKPKPIGRAAVAERQRATFCVRVQTAAVAEMPTGSETGPMRSPSELFSLSGHIFYHMVQGSNGLRKNISGLVQSIAAAVAARMAAILKAPANHAKT